ncbi:AraC family transcriptional regulator [Paenibacillus thailandensis]|uniref:AraC family transcriptional regulator n=2 Tax=Paenibacillus thailandensis TaxID=393250 RepID=A0ABW5QVX2_9BACL
MFRGNWYRRLLLSYFPIFLLTVTLLVFLSFIVINETSRKVTAKADLFSTTQVAHTVDESLTEIEYELLDRLQGERIYSSFLNRFDGNEDPIALYDVVQALNAFAGSNELIDSVYIYRAIDGQVLTSNGLVDLQSFADRPFIEQALAGSGPSGWSGVRTLASGTADTPASVISIYKRTPIPFGKQGLTVLNVNMYALLRQVEQTINSGVSYLKITDSEGNVVYNSAPDATDARIFNTVRSERARWTYESGILQGQLFGWVSVISYVWIVIGILIVVLAVVYIVYITRKNYKPIRLLMNRIEHVQLTKDSSGPDKDELSMIDQALQRLIRQTSEYENEHRENLLIARRQLFIEIVQGERLAAADKRLRKLKPLPEGVSFERVAVVVAEIANFGDFQRGFSAGDQSALKFALQNVLQELARNEGLAGWAEWIGSSRMGILVAMGGEEKAAKDTIRRFADKGLEWVSGHLGMTLLFGVGPVERGLDRIQHSCRAAVEALQHKLSRGKAAVIMSDELPGESGRGWYGHLQAMAELVKEFRLSTGDWRIRLDGIFASLEAGCLKDGEIRTLLQTMLDMLERELGDVSESLTEYFKGKQAEQFAQKTENSASLEQLKSLFFEHLTDIYRTYVAVCETKNHRAMINEMRAYIEEHFADPDLSLKHLSDRFDISGKYASYLFKEEFDMKFVDFLVQLRMKRAERLLAETDETVQNIALQVGYANSISFGRMFKRVVGVTPGDYRKLKIKPAP